MLKIIRNVGIFLKEYVLIHISHSSLYILEDYKITALLNMSKLEKENLLMCDFRFD